MDQSDDFEQTKSKARQETNFKKYFLREGEERRIMELSKLKKNERFATAIDSLPVSYETSTKKLHNRVPGSLKT